MPRPTEMPTHDEIAAIVAARCPMFPYEQREALVNDTLDILADPNNSWMLADPAAAVKLAIARSRRSAP